MSSKQAADSGYEKRDINLRVTIIVGAIIVLLIAVFLVALKSMFVLSSEKMMQDYVLKPESAPLRDLRASEMETLTTYKLLDPAMKVYRIPISRAMELMAEEAYLAHQSGGRK